MGQTQEVEGKDWAASQEYEMKHAIEFMDTDSFRNLHREVLQGRTRASTGYTNDVMLKEFFEGSAEKWQGFVEHIRGKTCVDVGPCVLSPLAGWDIAGARHVIEPLYPKIHEWQVQNLGESGFRDLVCHGRGAENPVEELVARVDGAILCRNVLDHTPSWPFVLETMASYALPGCRLLLWTDLDHHGTEDIGHYNIVRDVGAFKKLVTRFGFEIIREYQDVERRELNWGCLAIKT
jgi:hypothetical protein